MELEICCGDLQSVMAAKKGGTKRIELCSGLSEGGLTPSLGLIEGALSTGIPEVNVLIRPRQGDFLYSENEVVSMEKDIDTSCNAGVSGIVIGALKENGEIDLEICQRLIGRAKSINPEVNVTFHRAFDLSRDPFVSLEDVISLGCDTILTSGLAEKALTGKVMIRNLVKQAENRIKIMAGSGITPGNVEEIIKTTGVDAIHSSARSKIESGMKFIRKDVAMGSPENNEYKWQTTNPEIVKELIEIISKC